MKNYLAKSAGFIYLVLFSVFVSTAAIAGKIGFKSDISTVELLAVRFVLAAAVLWAYFLCFKRDASSRSSVRPRLDRAGFIGCMQVAVINSVSMWTYFSSLSYLDASLLTVIYVTAFIPAVMLLLMIRGEYPSRLDLFRFVVALIGIYLFVNVVVGELSWIGLVLAIITPFLTALYITIIQLRLGDYDPQTVTLYTLTFMSILFSLVYLALGYRVPQFDATTWGAVLWLAVFSSAVARLFLFAGIKIAGSRQAALLSPFETLLTILLAVWLLGESLTLPQWVGTLLVVASAALGAKAKSNRVRAKATKAPEVQPNAT
ncbi:MAG: DMT family transporter [Ardenticatenaceae bacterium]